MPTKIKKGENPEWYRNSEKRKTKSPTPKLPNLVN